MIYINFLCLSLDKPACKPADRVNLPPLFYDSTEMRTTVLLQDKANDKCPKACVDDVYHTDSQSMELNLKPYLAIPEIAEYVSAR